MPAFQPRCSVVVCTRYRSQTLISCLEALSHLDYPDFEVVVVDNSPGDTPTREVAERYRARYVLETVTGLSRARNRGSAVASSDVVAFVDDDAVPEQQWLSALVRQFEDPQVMAAVGRTLERSFNGASNDDYIDVWGKEKLIVDRNTPYWFQRANFGGIGNGGNMAFRRQAWDIWPGFDERLGLGASIEGGEEHYSFFSLIDRGYRVVYTPDAVVRHPSCHRSEQQVRDRFLQDCVSAGAYLAFLFCEEPKYSREVLRFVGESFLGFRRPWKSGAPVTRPVAPAWRVLFNRLRGLVAYLLFRMMDARKSVPGPERSVRAAGQSSPRIVSAPRSDKG